MKNYNYRLDFDTPTKSENDRLDYATAILICKQCTIFTAPYKGACHNQQRTKYRFRIHIFIQKNFSNEGFSIAVLEEYLLCIIITCISIFFKTYIVWVVIAHRLSTVTYISLKRYQNKKSSRSSKFVANLYYFKVIITNSLGISNLVIMLAIRVIHVAADILV